jgi:subtilisin family serine protease
VPINRNIQSLLRRKSQLYLGWVRPNYEVLDTDYGMATAKFSEVSDTLPGGTNHNTYFASTASFQLYPALHIDDTVKNAWEYGWNGKGVRIAIIDDFTNYIPPIKDKYIPVQRTLEQERGSYWGRIKGTYSLKYRFGKYPIYGFNYTHGDLVSAIAGGEKSISRPPMTVEEDIVSGKLLECVILRPGSGAGQVICPSTYHYDPVTSISLTAKTVGLARKASVVEHNVNLSYSQNVVQTFADIRGHLQNSSDYDVINLSLGKEIPATGSTFESFMAEISKNPLTKINAVITIAAGNGGGPCRNVDGSKTKATGVLNGCNEIAVALTNLTATNDSTIVVGATSGTGYNETIAKYSTRAGILKERFVLASGEADVGDNIILSRNFVCRPASCWNCCNSKAEISIPYCGTDCKCNSSFCKQRH